MMTRKNRLHRIEQRVRTLHPPESRFNIMVREIPIMKAWLAERNLTAQEALDRGETGPSGVQVVTLKVWANMEEKKGAREASDGDASANPFVKRCQSLP